jgi:predicted dehydrogenase
LRVLIIGLGSIAAKHIVAIQSINSSFEIFALRNTLESKSFEGVINLYSIENIEITFDFIIISNPTYLHGKSILEALKFNCPLFIEKPVLGNLNDVSILQKIIKQKNAITYIACNLRFHPLINFLKNYLPERMPHINEINVYCGSYLPDWRPGIDFRKVYSANADMGGGVHIDMIHELDYCIWLFGKPFEVRSLKRSASSLRINSIDFADFTLFYQNFVVNIQLNYFRRDTKRQIEIVTKDETLVGDLISNKLTSLSEGKVLFHSDFKMSDTYYEQMKYFITNIGKGEKNMNDFEEALSILKIALNE